ncbi:CDP-ribitol ribitolphosphotransferase [Pullulanibacillus pueri]|uniref:Glycosyl transferase group 2 n=1 Tax=Pullulanibacillus pueri TaxID=1437324 RepID=A0A8J3ELJ4_9BACL|nr:CDP-glycerol glycerophosphotransferase family protein [Pullulanibacillus pueri]MBM7683623.1 CDP-ribitol ribitolphosphotransferase [Pullulanibacillus pueri]GGH76592.1 glycosyl transferase group 2 [Pullulanibacillus pueri]
MYEEEIIPSASYSATIHDIEWERVNLKLEGLIAGDIDISYKFYLKRRNEDFTIPIKKIQISGHSFYLVLNVSTLNKDDRIPDGIWDLMIENEFGEVTKVLLAGNLTSEGEKEFHNCYDKNFKSGPKREYKVHPMFYKNSSSFSLDVHFKFPIPKTKKPKKRSLKRRISDLRINLYQFIFEFAKKRVKKNGRRVLFTSASRASMGGNLGAVYNRMVERGLDKEYSLKMAFKSNIWGRSKWIDKFKLPYYLGISDYILIEDYQPMVNNMNFDQDTEIIQLWHANGAFKTFGYSRLGKPASPQIDGINHRIYTKAITSSKHVIPYYAEAFAIDESKVVATGIPKTDMFLNEVYKKKAIDNVLNVFPQLNTDKKIILFGPTFRGGGPKTAYYPMTKIDFHALADYCRKNNAIVVFKLHFLVKNKLQVPEEYTDVLINATDYREINDILFIADVLITDYSSTIYEYSLLNKPMLFYAFDLEEYIATRDFYDDFKDFVPGKIVKNFDELLTALENNDYEFEKVEVFRNKNFEFLDAGASDRVIDWLILKKDQ